MTYQSKAQLQAEADLSYVNEATLNHLCCQVTLKSVTPTRPLLLEPGCSYLGAIFLWLHLDYQVLLHPCQVIQGPGCDITPGMDFIHHQGLRYQPHNQHFTWKETH
jgi:hypothetical protein